MAGILGPSFLRTFPCTACAVVLFVESKERRNQLSNNDKQRKKDSKMNIHQILDQVKPGDKLRWLDGLGTEVIEEVKLIKGRLCYYGVMRWTPITNICSEVEILRDETSTRVS